MLLRRGRGHGCVPTATGQLVRSTGIDACPAPCKAKSRPSASGTRHVAAVRYLLSPPARPPALLCDPNPGDCPRLRTELSYEHHTAAERHRRQGGLHVSVLRGLASGCRAEFCPGRVREELLLAGCLAKRPVVHCHSPAGGPEADSGAPPRSTVHPEVLARPGCQEWCAQQSVPGHSAY